MNALPDHLAPLDARRPLDRAAVATRQKDRIIEAAVPVFARRGYRATTVGHLTGAAKIALGTFYARFENRQDCFLAAYERTVDLAREEIAGGVDPSASWGIQALDALRGLLDWIEAHPHHARLALVEVQTGGPRALEAYEATNDSVVPLLEKGRLESPLAEELPPRLEIAIIGGLLWYLQQRIQLGEIKGWEEHLRDAAEIVIEPYLGAEKTRELLAGAEAV
jgi:AcrR family transcriptional regulator